MWVKHMQDILLNSQEFNSLTVGDNEEKRFIIIIDQNINQTVEITLAGINSRAEIMGIVIGNGNDQMYLKTKQNHLAPRSTSSLIIKSILDDKSVFNFEGLIYMDKKAQAADAYQRNDNLLLSKYVKCNTKPYLEILANDVRCTHGATIGKINEEQIFYLQSRGLNLAQAQKLIISGYIQTLLDKISDLAIVELLQKKISQKLYGRFP